MGNDEPWTIKRLLEWTTNYLKQNGADSPRLDAEVLLAEARNCQRIQLYTSYDVEPLPGELDSFRKWIQQRAEGTPVAYLVGHKEFYSLSFTVNRNVLIPRPETELLVTTAIDFLKEKSSQDESKPAEATITSEHSTNESLHPATRDLKVCDLGTGSGCIAIAIAKNAPNCQIVAIDRSPEALEVARQNASRHSVEDRIEFLQSDLFSELSPNTEFDAVVSNPPYVSSAEYEVLAREVKAEPQEALVSGEQGTETIQQIISQSGTLLRERGLLAIELSPMIAERCLEILSRNDQFENCRLVSDLSKQPRIVTARKK